MEGCRSYVHPEDQLLETLKELLIFLIPVVVVGIIIVAVISHKRKKQNKPDDTGMNGPVHLDIPENNGSSEENVEYDENGGYN